MEKYDYLNMYHLKDKKLINLGKLKSILREYFPQGITENYKFTDFDSYNQIYSISDKNTNQEIFRSLYIYLFEPEGDSRMVPLDGIMNDNLRNEIEMIKAIDEKLENNKLNNKDENESQPGNE